MTRIPIFAYSAESPLETRFSTAQTALSAALDSQDELVVICDNALSHVANERAPSCLGTSDMVHAGLLLGGGGLFNSLSLTGGASWWFVDPAKDRRCTSWKATPALCWIRPAQVREIGGEDQAYRTASSRLMDIAYRLLEAGGRVVHVPDVVAERDTSKLQLPTLPLADEFVFIFRHFGKASALYAAFWHGALVSNPLHAWRSLIEARNRVRRFQVPHTHSGQISSSHLLGISTKREIKSISAIIPTLDRYEYLPRAIQSLLQQSPPPDEIIIVDQTPPSRRRTDIYEPFGNKVSAIFLESTGQSLARNAGIEAAQGEWCLFFDDDSVAWDDMLPKHVGALERCEAQVSTGVSLAPWKNRSHIPDFYRKFHLASVLDTGNSLVKREVLMNVGGLDRAFDHGSGADNDLGMRLYLSGTEILFNPHAIRTHYKAPSGGLRTYGAWWRDRTGLFSPFPPPTTIYAIRRHFPRVSWWPMYLRPFVLAKRRLGWKELLWLWLNAPWKLSLSLHRARRLNSAPGDSR